MGLLPGSGSDGMSWRRTLAVPIIALMVVIALATLLIGYWISLSNLRRSLEAREEDRVAGIHSVVEAIIATEIDKLTGGREPSQEEPQPVGRPCCLRCHEKEVPLEEDRR